jgi:hypothetical protein
MKFFLNYFSPKKIEKSGEEIDFLKPEFEVIDLEMGKKFEIIIKQGGKKLEEIAKKALDFLGAEINQENIASILTGEVFRPDKGYYKGRIEYEADGDKIKALKIIIEIKKNLPYDKEAHSKMVREAKDKKK